MTEPESSLDPNTPYQQQKTIIKLILAATHTLVSIRGFFPEAKLSQTPSESTSKQTMNMSLVCISESSTLVLLWATLHFQHVGVGGLSFCIHVQMRVLLCVCVCKPAQSTKRLILQAKQLLSDICGGVQYVCCVLCLCG